MPKEQFDGLVDGMNGKGSSVMEDPLCIQRHNLHRFTISDTNLTQGPAETEDLDNNGKNNHRKGILKKILRKRNSSSEILYLKPSPSPGSECYTNALFRSEDALKHECFIAAFGQKGKNIGEFQDAKDITCLPRNRLLIADLINNRLQICSDVTSNVTLFSPNEISQPWATSVTKNNYIAVTLCRDKCVKILNTDGNVIVTFGEDIFSYPTGIAIDDNGNFIVCDAALNKVLMFDADGNFLRYLGNKEDQYGSLSKPGYVCFSHSGEILVSDAGHHKVKIFDRNGDFIRSFGSFGRGDSQFKCPYGICTNKYGDIFVADHYNSRISMFAQDGSFIRHLVTSEHGLVHPQGLTLSADLHLYVTHGHLKASEILVFQLTNEVDFEAIDTISYV